MAAKKAEVAVQDRPKLTAAEIKARLGGAKIVAHTSPKGGSTKTSLTRIVAVAASQAGVKAATLDFDRQRTLTKWWAKRPENGVVQFDHHEGTLDDVDAPFLEMEGEGYGLIAVDTPPGLEDHPEAFNRLLDLADFVLVPTSPSQDDRESVIPFMVKHVMRIRKPSAFVIGRAKKRTKSLERAKNELVKVGRLCPIVIPDTEDIANAFELGYTVLDMKGGNGSAEAEGVWHFLRNELGI